MIQNANTDLNNDKKENKEIWEYQCTRYLGVSGKISGKKGEKTDSFSWNLEARVGFCNPKKGMKKNMNKTTTVYLRCGKLNLFELFAKNCIVK